MTLTAKPATWPILDAATGSLSSPSKMPCYSWSIPAELCKVGSLLRKIKGSTCSTCYALKGNYKRYPNVFKALNRRLDSWKSDRPGWIQAMAASISKRKNPHFRWFDSGDLQGLAMLQDIVEVCKLTPEVSHWLPTRENAVLTAYVLEFGELPDNLTPRRSAAMIGETLAPSSKGPLKDIPVSMVHTDKAPKGSYACPSSKQSGKCLDCRACWSKDIKQVSYAAH